LVPLVIAHRGDSAHRPENTLVSFQSALDVGADLVELDVQRTRDGHVVVLHDVTVDRTTDGNGKITDLTLAQIRAFSAGYSERFGSQYAKEKIPTLGEALALLRGRTRVMIEIKKESVGADDSDDGIEALTVEEVRRVRMAADVVLISFERRALLRCKARAPEMKRGQLFYRAEPEDVVAIAKEVETDLVMPEKGMLSETLREQVRAAGINMATWVVDDPAELRDLTSYDLYGVGSNCPGVLLDALWGRD
jgi:glycerophosphoryl diester phosphodiesterase